MAFRFTIPQGRKVGNVCELSHSRFGATGSVIFHSTGAIGDDSKYHASTYLLATNGRIAAVCPVECQDDQDAPLPRMMLPPEACNANGKALSVEVNGEVRSTSGKKTSVLPLPEQQGRFPNLRMVFPEPDKLAGYTCVSLDVEYLLDLARAIGDGSVTLLIPPANPNLLDGEGETTGAVTEPIVVVGLDNDGGQPGIGMASPLVHNETRKTALATWERHWQNLPTSSLAFQAKQPEPAPAMSLEVPTHVK